MSEIKNEVAMTCGHMSTDPDKCPHGCPESKMSEVTATSATPNLDTLTERVKADHEQKRNYLQEVLATFESHLVLLSATLQELRHEMEKDYGLQTLTTDDEDAAAQ